MRCWLEIQESWESSNNEFVSGPEEYFMTLDIYPQQLLLRKRGCVVFEANDLVWYNTLRPDARGLAAPVARLLDELT